jgi:hypothetical protein
MLLLKKPQQHNSRYPGDGGSMFFRNVSADLSGHNNPNLHHREKLKSICLRRFEAAMCSPGVYTPLFHADTRTSSRVGVPMAILITFSWSRVSHIPRRLCGRIVWRKSKPKYFLSVRFSSITNPKQSHRGGGGGAPCQPGFCHSGSKVKI